MEKEKLDLLLEQFEHGKSLEDYHKITTWKELDEHYIEHVRKLNHHVVSGFIEVEDVGLNHLFQVLEKGDFHSKQKAVHILEEIGKKLRAYITLRSDIADKLDRLKLNPRKEVGAHPLWTINLIMLPFVNCPIRISTK